MGGGVSSHIKRWVTGIIAVPLLAAIIIFGGEKIFAVLIAAVILVGVVEYSAMVFGQSHAWEKTELIVAAVLVFLAMYAGKTPFVLAALIISFIMVFCLALPRVSAQNPDFMPAAKVVLGIVYVPLLMAYFLLIRRFENGVLWVFFALVVAFAGDTGAFYVGRTWGKRKLLPAVSPGKTVEGIYGLIAGGVIGCLLFQHFLLPEIPLVHAVLMGFFGSLLGQLGDLWESLLKRASGVKDSGAILPGHGGILDRLDSLLFIAPFIYYYRSLII